MTIEFQLEASNAAASGQHPKALTSFEPGNVMIVLVFSCCWRLRQQLQSQPRSCFFFQTCLCLVNIEFYLEASESGPAPAKPKLPKPPQAHVSVKSNTVDAWACFVVDVSLLLEGDCFFANMFWMIGYCISPGGCEIRASSKATSGACLFRVEQCCYLGMHCFGSLIAVGG